MPEDGDKVAVSTEDLNEVRTSLESSMDTKMSKIESKIDQFTELINNLMMNKAKPTVVVSEDADSLSEAALKAAADEQSALDDNPEKNKDGASTTPKIGEGVYSSVPPFKSADPPMNHHHINNIRDPPKINTIDFERWQF